MSRENYNQMKVDICLALEEIRDKKPNLAEYLEKHLVFDDDKMTVKYTGDGRVAIDKIFA